MAASDEVLGHVTSPEYLQQAGRAVPAHLDVPGDEGHAVFLQVDFAIVRGEDGELTPRLIELQGFPSLYGFQWLLEKEYRAHFPAIPADVTPYFGGLTAETYPAALRDVIVADCDPENAVLLEIDPEHQKTRIDFCVTEQLLGIPVVDARGVIERGGRLYLSAERPRGADPSHLQPGDLRRGGAQGARPLAHLPPRPGGRHLGGAPELVSEDQQVFAPLHPEPLLPADLVRERSEGASGRPGELRPEAALLLRRPRRRAGTDPRAPALAAGPRELHPAEEGGLRRRHRDPRRSRQGRDPHDVPLEQRRGRTAPGWSTTSSASARGR